MNKTKLLRGMLFLIIGILFMFVKFYEISYANADGKGFLDIIRFYDLEQNWFELFKPTIISNVLGILFILVGTLEIKEAFTHGN